MSRPLVTLAALGALLQFLGGILETVDRVEAGEPGFGLRTTVIGLAYLFLVGAVIALARSGAAGASRVASGALIVAGAGWAGSAVAQILLNVVREFAETVLFPIATIAVGAGMLIAGVAVARVRRWAGWHRWAPLVCGLYPFVVIFPSFAISGGPNFLVLSVWGLCWVLLAAALWTGPRRQRSATAVPVSHDHATGS